MKVVLISGNTPPPEELRAMVARGSTALVEQAAGDAGSVDDPAADRVVFWAAGGDEAVRDLAERYGRATDRRADVIVFVSAAGAAVPKGLSATERFEWPADEDRLRMAFETGA
jgi:hypothetical protein